MTFTENEREVIWRSLRLAAKRLRIARRAKGLTGNSKWDRYKLQEDKIVGGFRESELDIPLIVNALEISQRYYRNLRDKAVFLETQNRYEILERKSINLLQYIKELS